MTAGAELIPRTTIKQVVETFNTSKDEIREGCRLLGAAEKRLKLTFDEDERTRHTYAHDPRFAAMLRRDTRRKILYGFIKHWLESFSARPDWYRRRAPLWQ